MDKPELLPCPFCGGKPTAHENDWCEPPEYTVACLECGIAKHGNSGRDEAIAAWNRRPLDAARAENERLREGVEEQDIYEFLCRKYVQRADGRQRAMGLHYTEAETHDLADEIGKFIRAALKENTNG